MPIAIKLGRDMTYRKGHPSMESNDPLTTESCDNM